jgi:hypothetical protein
VHRRSDLQIANHSQHATRAIQKKHSSSPKSPDRQHLYCADSRFRSLHSSFLLLRLHHIAQLTMKNPHAGLSIRRAAQVPLFLQILRSLGSRSKSGNTGAEQREGRFDAGFYVK